MKHTLKVCDMKKYFAQLDGDLIGIDRYIGFYAENKSLAQEFADQKAEENFSEYEDPFDEGDCPKFFANVEEWDDKKHDPYIGDACFTMYE